jgi:hypothetical protein
MLQEPFIIVSSALLGPTSKVSSLEQQLDSRVKSMFFHSYDHHTSKEEAFDYANLRIFGDSSSACIYPRPSMQVKYYYIPGG